MSDEHGSVFQPINQSDMIARIESFDHDDADQSYITPEPASFVAAPVAEVAPAPAPAPASRTCTCSRTGRPGGTGTRPSCPGGSRTRSGRRGRTCSGTRSGRRGRTCSGTRFGCPGGTGTCSSCPGRSCSSCPGGYRACSGRRGRSSPNSSGRGRDNSGRAGSDRRSRTGVSSRRPCPCPPHPLHPRWPGSCCWSVRPRSCR